MYDPVSTIQAALDYLLPGNTVIDPTYDIEALVSSNFIFNLTFVGSVDVSKSIEPLKCQARFKPKLRTSYAPKRNNHQILMLAALYKRNMVNAHFAYPSDFGNLAEQACEYAFDTLMLPGWRERLSLQRESPHSINQETVAAWAAAQSPSKLARLESEYKGKSLMDLSLNEYNIFLKPLNKPLSDLTTQTEVQQPQTVVYSPVEVNARFGAIFRSAEQTFIDQLRPNVLYNKKKDLPAIEKFINDADIPIDERNFKYFENDFSAYDKAQHIETWTLERTVYEMLGVDPELLSVWMDSHWSTKIRSPAVGLTMWLLFQRKSGDVTTSFGNTIVGMICVIYCFQISTFVYGLFLGDDSLIKVRNEDIDYAKLANGPRNLLECFNLPSKFYIYNTGYFCGYIIAKIGLVNVLISDAMRRAIKLGRMDIRSESEFHEHWMSFKDVTRNYHNELAIDLAVDALTERLIFSDVLGLSSLYRALASLGRSYKEFRRCWDAELSDAPY